MIEINGQHYSEVRSNNVCATLQRKFYVTVGTAACVACSAIV
jgi:hypothetical protein